MHGVVCTRAAVSSKADFDSVVDLDHLEPPIKLEPDGLASVGTVSFSGRVIAIERLF
jgi:hypothetical protein